MARTVTAYGNETTKIFHGDGIEVLQGLPDESIDLVFCDPPYNIGKRIGHFSDVWRSDAAYTEWCQSWLKLCCRKLKRCGSLYFMTSTQAMPFIDIWLRSELVVLSRIVWQYDSSGVQAKKHFGSMYEPILFCVKDDKSYTFNADDIEVEARTGAVRKLIDYRSHPPRPYNSTKVPGNTWYMPRVRYRMPEYEDHPTQKPEALLERIIRASSNPGDVVLDPFSGTFTTSAVAQRLGRRSIGVELQEQYVEIGLRRLSLATHHNGQMLAAVRKNNVKRNRNGVRALNPELDRQKNAFDG